MTSQLSQNIKYCLYILSLNFIRRLLLFVFYLLMPQLIMSSFSSALISDGKNRADVVSGSLHFFRSSRKTTSDDGRLDLSWLKSFASPSESNSLSIWHLYKQHARHVSQFVDRERYSFPYDFTGRIVRECEVALLLLHKPKRKQPRRDIRLEHFLWYDS